MFPISEEAELDPSKDTRISPPGVPRNWRTTKTSATLTKVKTYISHMQKLWTVGSITTFAKVVTRQTVPNFPKVKLWRETMGSIRRGVGSEEMFGATMAAYRLAPQQGCRIRHMAQLQLQFRHTTQIN